MNLCLITPTAGLERYGTLTRTHLVLAHVNNPRYIYFYQQRAAAGDTLILDNGAHEWGHAAAFHILESAMIRLEPNIVVLPDHIDKGRETVSESLRFLDKNAFRFPKTAWMFVPQGSGWRECLQRIVEDSRVGHLVTWVGVPRSLTLNHGLSRRVVAGEIKTICPSLKLHAMGMCNGSVQEFKALQACGLFESLDTSVPVWRGWNNYPLSDPSWPEIPVDFSAAPNSFGDDIIKENLNALGIDTITL